MGGERTAHGGGSTSSTPENIVFMVSIIRTRRCYKSSAPRAADAARHGRASKNTTQCEGGRMKRPMIGFS